MKILRYLGYLIFRPIWWLERLVPRKKNLWIFGAWYGKKYSDNSKYLYEYVLKWYPEVNAIWITKSKEIVEKLKAENKRVFLSNSFGGICACLFAKHAFLTSGVIDVNPLFLNGCKQIWLWHGMPLKKIGYCDDLSNHSSKIKRILVNLFNPYHKLDPYCTLTSADFFTPFLMEAFHISEDKIWRTGLPRCDAFFSDGRETYIDRLRHQYPSSKIMLYMPTFRMSSRMDGMPFIPFVSDFGFNEQEFIDFLEHENIVFLYKPHFVDSAVTINIHSSRFKLLCDGDFSDLYVLLNNVDELITDYSSVYFDFLAADKPISLLIFDYDEYVANSRSHFFDMKKEMHGKICTDWKAFYEMLKDKNDFGYLTVDKIKFASFLKGESCKNVVEKVCSEF